MNLKFDENALPYFEKITTVKKWNLHMRDWVKDNSATKIEKITVEEYGLLKKFETHFIVRRTINDEETYEKKSALFLQTVIFEIPNENSYRYHYIAIANGKPFLTIINPKLGNYCGITSKIQVNDREFTRLFGRAKKISDSEANLLLMQRKALAKFELTEEGLVPFATTED